MNGLSSMDEEQMGRAEDVEQVMYSFTEQSKSTRTRASLSNEHFFVKWKGKSVREGTWVSRDLLTENQVLHFRENVEPTLPFQVTGTNDKRVLEWDSNRVVQSRVNAEHGEECLMEWNNHPVATWEPLKSVPQKMILDFKESGEDSGNANDSNTLNTTAAQTATTTTTTTTTTTESPVATDADGDQVMQNAKDATPATPRSNKNDRGKGRRKSNASSCGKTPTKSKHGVTETSTDSTKRTFDNVEDAEIEDSQLSHASESSQDSRSSKKCRIVESEEKENTEQQQITDVAEMDELAIKIKHLDSRTIFHILDYYTFPFNRYIHMILRYLNHLKSKSNRKDSITPEKLFFGYFKRDSERTPFMIFRNLSLCDPCSLIPLSMRRTVVEDKHLLEVFVNLPHLKSIRIDRSQVSTFAINGFLEKNNGLEYLEFHYPNDGYASQMLFDMPDLVMPKMRKLRFGFSSGMIEDTRDVKDIMKHMVNLDDVVERIFNICPNLTVLDVDDSCEMTTISDKGLEILFQKMRLRKLSMVCVGIGASQLARYLSKNTTMTHLSVKSSLHNGALDAITKHPKLHQFRILLQQAFIIADKGSIKQSSLPRVISSDRWRRFLTRPQQRNQHFSIAFEQQQMWSPSRRQSTEMLMLQRQQRIQVLESTKTLLDALANTPPTHITLKGLEMIALPKRVANHWTPKHFETLANIPTLRKLKLVHCGVHDSLLYELAHSPFIEELTLNHNRKTTDAGVRSLLLNKTLKRLELVGNDKVTDDCIIKSSSSLSKSNLNTLCLSQTSVRNIGTNFLIKSCPSLETLDLHMCQLSDEAFSNLPNNTTLKNLVVAGCTDITDEFLVLAAQSTALEFLNVQYCFNLTTEGYTSLSDSPSVAEINIATDRVLPYKGFNYDQWVSTNLRDVTYAFASMKNLCRLVISHEQFAKQKDYRDLIEKSNIMLIEMPKRTGFIN